MLRITFRPSWPFMLLLALLALIFLSRDPGKRQRRPVRQSPPPARPDVRYWPFRRQEEPASALTIEHEGHDDITYEKALNSDQFTEEELIDLSNREALNAGLNAYSHAANNSEWQQSLNRLRAFGAKLHERQHAYSNL